MENLNAPIALLSGVAGPIITNIISWLQAKGNHSRQMELKRFALEERKFEIESNLKLTLTVEDIRLKKQVEDNVTLAMESEFRRSSFDLGDILTSTLPLWLKAIITLCRAFVDLTRDFIRPLVTIIALTVIVYFAFSDSQSLTSKWEAILTSSYAIIGWWFGDRMLLKRK